MCNSIYEPNWQRSRHDREAEKEAEKHLRDSDAGDSELVNADNWESEIAGGNTSFVPR